MVGTHHRVANASLPFATLAACLRACEFVGVREIILGAKTCVIPSRVDDEGPRHCRLRYTGERMRLFAFERSLPVCAGRDDSAVKTACLLLRRPKRELADTGGIREHFGGLLSRQLGSLPHYLGRNPLGERYRFNLVLARRSVSFLDRCEPVLGRTACLTALMRARAADAHRSPSLPRDGRPIRLSIPGARANKGR